VARARRDERGVVLVLWALSFGALSACLALALELGDLQQRAANTQDAADSAALAVAGQLGPALPLFTYTFVQTCKQGHGKPQCPCPIDLAKGCNNYSWLDDDYIYVGGRGWLQVVPPPALGAGQVPPPAGQIYDVTAFQHGLRAGWYCSSEARTPKPLCSEVATGVVGSGPGALSDEMTAVELDSAAQAAEHLASTTYFAGSQSVPDWQSCGPPPAGFALASSATNCVAYEAGPAAYWPSGASPSGSDYIVVWAEVPGRPGAPTRDATATWRAGAQTNGASPAPPFGPVQASGQTWLCALATRLANRGTCA
jgi:hypothetical protein